MIDRLLEWGSGYWQTKWLIDHWIPEWLIDWYFDWWIDSLIDSLIDKLFEWVIKMIDWFVVCLSDCLVDWLLNWLIDWLADQLYKPLISWEIQQVYYMVAEELSFFDFAKTNKCIESRFFSTLISIEDWRIEQQKNIFSNQVYILQISIVQAGK